jgi:hypothetical protein
LSSGPRRLSGHQHFLLPKIKQTKTEWYEITILHGKYIYERWAFSL